MVYPFEQIIEHKSSVLFWNHRINVPLDIANKLIDKDRRVICTINDKIKIHCALMPDGNGQYFIILNKANRKKLGVEQLSKLSIILKNDKSTYGIKMPLELKELMEQDEEGHIYFHKLTPGKQRSLIHIVAKYKSEQKRLEKAIIMIEYLKSVHGKLDYKELNLAYKKKRFLY